MFDKPMYVTINQGYIFFNVYRFEYFLKWGIIYPWFAFQFSIHLLENNNNAKLCQNLASSRDVDTCTIFTILESSPVHIHNLKTIKYGIKRNLCGLI